MSNSQEQNWPTSSDMDRIWDATQHSIIKRKQGAKRRKIGLITSAGVLAVGITAGAIIIPATLHQTQFTVRCYSAQSSDSSYTDVALVDGETALNIEGAISNCGAIWAYGYLIPGKTVEPEENRGPITTAPPLGVCMQPNNILGVFPLTDATGRVLSQEEICEKVKLRLPGSQ
ncbi:hypothetical protein [Arthrobacter sp. HLT1-20]